MSKRVEPFVLIVTDQDHKKFTVEGPMTDDRPWNAAICDAQANGRAVNCHAPGDAVRSNVEGAANTYQESYPDMIRFPSGSIVRVGAW